MSITKKERESLRAQLAKFELPKWARFVAVDEDGEVYAYVSRPKLDPQRAVVSWLPMGLGRYDNFGEIALTCDWRETLFTVEELRAPKRSHKKKTAVEPKVAAAPEVKEEPKPEEKVLSIYLKRIHSTLVFAVLEQKGLPKEKKEGIISIVGCPAVFSNALFLRGVKREDDNHVSKQRYSTLEAAEDALKFFLDAIGKELFALEAREPKQGDMVDVRDTAHGFWKTRRFVMQLPSKYKNAYVCESVENENLATNWGQMRPIASSINFTKDGDVYTWRAGK